MYVSSDVNKDLATSLPDDPAALRAMLLRVIDERDEIARTRDEIARTRDTLEDRVAALEYQKIVLEHQNRTLLTRLYGKKSERLSDEDLVLFHGFMQETLKADGEPTLESDGDANAGDDAKKPNRKRSGRPSGENAVPRHLVAAASTVVHELPADRRACACGVEMEACGETTRITIEYVPAKVFAVRHVRVGYRCQACKTFAAAPAAPIPVQKSIASPGLLAAVIVGKYSDHLPLYRLEGILKRSGLDLTRQTMCGWLWPASQVLAPLVGLVRRLILSQSIILTDDTTAPMLDPGLGRTREGHFWSYLATVACGPPGVRERLVVYEFTPNHNHEHPHRFLKDFRGTLVSDAFAGYETLGREGRVTNAGCWAHVRRKFRDAIKLDERLCGEVLARITRIYAAERAIAKEIGAEIEPEIGAEAATANEAATPPAAATQSPAAPESDVDPSLASARRAVLRRERIGPLVADFFAYLASVQSKHVPKSDVAKAIEYVLKRPEWFTRFLDDGEIPIDNNACERSLRGIAVGRRNWLFVGSEGGGDAAAIFFSLLSSASLAEVEPYAYLTDVLERLAKIRNSRTPGMPKREPTDEELMELLPGAWLRANPKHRLPTNRNRSMRADAEASATASD
jgi:transposase